MSGCLAVARAQRLQQAKILEQVSWSPNQSPCSKPNPNCKVKKKKVLSLRMKRRKTGCSALLASQVNQVRVKIYQFTFHSSRKNPMKTLMTL